MTLAFLLVMNVGNEYTWVAGVEIVQHVLQVYELYSNRRVIFEVIGSY